MSDKTFSYKGYLGSIEFSLDDNCLYGRILFINDLVNYEAETLNELKNEFQIAVDDYLQTCQENGVNPDKSFSGTFNIRITPELHRKSSIKAIQNSQTLNEFITGCIIKGVEDNKNISREELYTYIYKLVDKQKSRKLYEEPNFRQSPTVETHEEFSANFNEIINGIKYGNRTHTY